MSTRKGFTLVEILIVVIILGILAAVALPKFSNASAAARASMLHDDLRSIRSQIMVFKGQHLGVSPGCLPGAPDPDVSLFVDHMTLSSDVYGNTAPVGTPGFKYGPYLREMPVNPVNGKSGVQIVANGAALPAGPSDANGWIYQADTCTFLSDAAGADEAGKLYFQY